jgi:hypothetical protein
VFECHLCFELGFLIIRGIREKSATPTVNLLSSEEIAVNFMTLICALAARVEA